MAFGDGTEVGSARVVITSDTGAMTAGLRSAQGEFSRFAGQLDGVNRNVSRSTSLFRMAGASLVGFAAYNVIVNGMGSAFGFVKDSVVDFNSQLEQSRAAFTTLTGSADKANEAMAILQKFARETPYDFEQLLPVAQQLLGTGTKLGDLVPVLTMLGNANSAVGGSAASLQQLTLAYTQVTTSGKANLQDLMQINNAVPGSIGRIADALHMSIGQFREAVSAGKISSAEVSRAMTTAFAKFSGSMDKQSHTFNGIMSNIHDSIQQTLSTAFLPLFKALEVGATKLADFTSSARFKTWANDVSGYLTGVIALLANFNGKAASPRAVAVAQHRGGTAQATPGAVDQIQSAIEGVDWGAVGVRVLKALAAALGKGSDLAETLANTLTDNADLFANAGALIAIKMANTMMDPSFWRKNWEDMLLLLLNFIPFGKFVSVGGRMGQLLFRAFGRAGGRLLSDLFEKVVPDMAKASFSVMTGIARAGFTRLMGIGRALFGRLPGIVQRVAVSAFHLLATAGMQAFNHIGDEAGRILSQIAAWLDGKVGRAVSQITGKFTGWVLKVNLVRGAVNLVTAAFNGVTNAIQTAIGWVEDLINKISEIHMPDLNPLHHLGLATGTTNWRGGYTWVGEHGPEIAWLPRGSAVTPHHNTMAAGREMGGGDSINVNISLQTLHPGDSRTLRAIHQAVSAAADKFSAPALYSPSYEMGI